MVDLVVSIPTTELVYANRRFIVRICLLAKKQIKNIVVKHILTKDIKIYDKGKGEVEGNSIVFSPDKCDELKYLHSNYAYTIEYEAHFSKKIPDINIIIDKDTVNIDNLVELEDIFQETKVIVEYELYDQKEDKKRKKLQQKSFTFQLAIPMFEIMDPGKYGYYVHEEGLYILPVRNIGDVDAYSTKIDVNLNYFAETLSGTIKFVTQDKYNNPFAFNILIKPLDVGPIINDVNVKEHFEIDILTRSNRPVLLACETNQL